MHRFGNDDGELDGRAAVLASQAAEDDDKIARGVLKASARRHHRPKPVITYGDVAVWCFTLAAIIAAVWWAS